MKPAYTFVELMMVLLIIASLATLSALRLRVVRVNQKVATVGQSLQELATAMTQYAEDNNYVYPADVARGLPPGLEAYVPANRWPATSPWKEGVYDYDNWTVSTGQLYQMSYRLCNLDDPESSCCDATRFPKFTRNSAILYCISGSCIAHESSPNDPAYCVNCRNKEIGNWTGADRVCSH